MNASDLFNVILWGGAAAIFIVAKIRGRDGRLCLETVYAGLAVLGCIGAIDCAARGETFMGVLVGLVALTAVVTVFKMRSERKVPSDEVPESGK